VGVRLFASLLVLAGIGLGLAACGQSGGSSGGVGTGLPVSGSFLGRSFTAKDVACNNCGHGLTYVTLSDGAGSFCGGNAVTANASLVLFNFGTPHVGQTSNAVVDFVTFDPTCTQLGGAHGDGMVTTTAADATSVSGHFSATLDAGAVSGDFVAPFCATPSSCK
jgi:hypothetical protein